MSRTSASVSTRGRRSDSATNAPTVVLPVPIMPVSQTWPEGLSSRTCLELREALEVGGMGLLEIADGVATELA